MCGLIEFASPSSLNESFPRKLSRGAGHRSLSRNALSRNALRWSRRGRGSKESNPRPTNQSMPPSEAERRAARHPAELVCEVRLAAEADLECDVREWLISAQKESLGPLDPARCHETVRGDSHRNLERAREVGAAQADLACQIGERYAEFEAVLAPCANNPKCP